jgi:hypothetical protein
MNTTFFKFIILSIILIFLSEIANLILDFKELYYNSLTEQFTLNQIKNYIEFQEKWKWVGYILVPIFITIKTFLITIVLYIGVFFITKSVVTFKGIWEIVINAEFFFLFIPIFKIIWFSFFQKDYKLIDIQFFYPFSALNFMRNKELEPWLIYPLQIINLFEFIYIIYLSYQLGHLTNTNPDKGIKIVAISYIPALLLWVTTVMFFTLNFS